MIETHDETKVQANEAHADVRLAAMSEQSTSTIDPGSEWRRTFVALVSASVISLVVWGLVVALNVH